MRALSAAWGEPVDAALRVQDLRVPEVRNYGAVTDPVDAQQQRGRLSSTRPHRTGPQGRSATYSHPASLPREAMYRLA